MDKNLKLYLADVADDADGLLRLSLVSRPATGCACKVVGVSDEYVNVFAPVIVANRAIYRRDDHLGEYNLLFLPEVIKDIQERAAVTMPSMTFDIEHSGRAVSGIVVLQSFLIDSANGMSYADYEGLTDGTWCMVLAIPRGVLTAAFPNMVFADIDTGTSPHDFFGISMSGIFTYEEVTLSDAIDIYNKIR